jgi:hypothetical protein
MHVTKMGTHALIAAHPSLTLKDWFLELFYLSGLALSMQTHHRLGKDRTSRSEYNRRQEHEQLKEPTFLVAI